MHQQDDLTQLSRTGKICKRVRIVFEKIRDEIIDTFGVSSEFLNIHQSNIKLELLRCEYMHTKDRTLIFEIQIEEKFLEDMLKPMKSINLFDAMIWIKKQQQVSFDENTITTFWFLKYMDYFMKQIKKQPKDHGRK